MNKGGAAAQINSLCLPAVSSNRLISYGYLRLPTVTYGYLRLPTVTYGYLRLPTVTYGYLRLPTVTYGYLRLPTVTYGYLRLPTATYGYLRLPTTVNMLTVRAAVFFDQRAMLSPRNNVLMNQSTYGLPGRQLLTTCGSLAAVDRYHNQ